MRFSILNIHNIIKFIYMTEYLNMLICKRESETYVKPKKVLSTLHIRNITFINKLHLFYKAENMSVNNAAVISTVTTI